MGEPLSWLRCTLWVFVGVIACPAAYRRRARAVTYRATNATQINKKKGR